MGCTLSHKAVGCSTSTATSSIFLAAQARTVARTRSASDTASKGQSCQVKVLTIRYQISTSIQVISIDHVHHWQLATCAGAACATLCIDQQLSTCNIAADILYFARIARSCSLAARVINSHENRSNPALYRHCHHVVTKNTIVTKRRQNPRKHKHPRK